MDASTNVSHSTRTAGGETNFLVRLNLFQPELTTKNHRTTILLARFICQISASLEYVVGSNVAKSRKSNNCSEDFMDYTKLHLIPSQNILDWTYLCLNHHGPIRPMDSWPPTPSGHVVQQAVDGRLHHPVLILQSHLPWRRSGSKNGQCAMEFAGEVEDRWGSSMRTFYGKIMIYLDLDGFMGCDRPNGTRKIGALRVKT